MNQIWEDKRQEIGEAAERAISGNKKTKRELGIQEFKFALNTRKYRMADNKYSTDGKICFLCMKNLGCEKHKNEQFYKDM